MTNETKKGFVQRGIAQQVWAGQEMSFCQFASDMDFSEEFKYGGYISSADFLDILATIVPDRKSTKNLDKKLPRQLYIDDVKEQLRNPDRGKPSHLAAMSESDWASYKHSIKAKFEICYTAGEYNVPVDASETNSLALYRSAENVYEKKITKRDVSYYNSLKSLQRSQTPLLSINDLYTQFFEAHIIKGKHMGRDETFKAFRCQTNCLTKGNLMVLIEHCVQCRPRVQKGTEASLKAEPQRAEKREMKRKAAPNPEGSDETFTSKSKRARNVRSASTRQPAKHNTSIKQNNSRYIETPNDDDDEEDVIALCGATNLQASGTMSMYPTTQTTLLQPMPSLAEYHRRTTNYLAYGSQTNQFAIQYIPQQQIVQPMEEPSMYNPQAPYRGYQNISMNGMNGMNGSEYNAQFGATPVYEGFNQYPNLLTLQGGNIDLAWSTNSLNFQQRFNHNGQAPPAEEVADNFDNANIDPVLFSDMPSQPNNDYSIRGEAPLQMEQDTVNNNHAIQGDAPLQMEQGTVNKNHAIQDGARLSMEQDTVNNNHAIQNGASLPMEQDTVNNNHAIQDDAHVQMKQNTVNNNHAIQDDALLGMEQFVVDNNYPTESSWDDLFLFDDGMDFPHDPINPSRDSFNIADFSESAVETEDNNNNNNNDIDIDVDIKREEDER